MVLQIHLNTQLLTCSDDLKVNPGRSDIMNVKCKKCQAGFNFDDDLIKEGGVMVRCSKCDHTFRVNTSAPSPPVFEIIRNYGCPLYGLGEEFRLSDNVFFPPYNKPPCLILVKDLMKIIDKNPSGKQKEESPADSDPETIFTCGGCKGKIEFSYKEELFGKDDNYISVLLKLLSRFPIFDGIDKDDIRNVASLLKLDRFAEGDFILKQGDFGRYLFIILSGKVDVLDGDGMSIASMGKGDVFGEMSLLSGVPVGATVIAREPGAVLRISGENLRNVLTRHPSFQMNFIRLLIQRVSEINLVRYKEFACGVTGKLSEISPSDLFQAFNISEKTGVLTLKLPDKSAYLSFREGQLINVKYSGKEGEEAFFELLKQRKGRFQYLSGLSPEEMRASEIGDFMGLLIEGLRRIDEEDRSFLRTVIPTLMFDV